MIKFSLEEYLKDTSVPVVNGKGNIVRIICTDAKSYQDKHIIGLELCSNGEVEKVQRYRLDGTLIASNEYYSKLNRLFLEKDSPEIDALKQALILGKIGPDEMSDFIEWYDLNF